MAHPGDTGMNAVTRTLPLPLEHPLPPCSMCGQTTDYDDGRFYCDHCGASWHGERSHLHGYSRWDNPALTQCPATVRPYGGDASPYLSKVVYRCLLSEAHRDQHRGTCERGDDIHEWTDDDADGYVTESLREYAANFGEHAGAVPISAAARLPDGGPGAAART